jgi:hypothetical protein
MGLFYFIFFPSNGMGQNAPNCPGANGRGEICTIFAEEII